MKKILVFLMVFLTLCSSVFAKEKTTDNEKLTPEEQRLFAEAMATMIDSKLDLKRWEFVTISTNNDYYFIDKETVTMPFSDTLEFWECVFRQAGKGSCGSKICKEKNIDTAKHYHYTRYKYDLSHLKSTVTSMSTKDENGVTVFSLNVPTHIQMETEREVFPESVGEKVMLKAQEIARKKKKK